MGNNPKFLSKNLITSTSMITVSSGSSTKIRLIDRNTDIQWSTVGETTGTRTITITFAAATTITRIFLQGINWKGFEINDGANALALETENAETDLYYEVNAVNITTLAFVVTETMTTGENIKCGELYAGTELFEMAAATSGVLRVSPEVAQQVFNLSDGTTYKIYVKKLFGFNIQLENITSTERTNYLNLYNRNRRETFVFIPYPKTANWDGVAVHCNWVNVFNIDNYDNDIIDNNYNGSIELKQAGGLG